MKFKKKAILLVSAILMAIIVSSASYTFASEGKSHKYSEPQIRPSGLPTEAKFNSDKNEYYDSSSIEWDSAKQRYIAKEQPVNITAENLQETSCKDWVNQHKDSTDPIDIALVKYSQEMEVYISEHPEFMFHSNYEVGDNGGPLNILTNLGVEGLPGLLKEVDVNNPFVIPVMIAVHDICKTNIGYTLSDAAGVTAWKLSFNNKLSDARKVVMQIVQKLNNNVSINDDEINNLLATVGIFALPYFYDEVNNNSNSYLLKYSGKILPDNNLREFNIESGSQDSPVNKKVLESSTNEIKILINLVAK